MNPSISQLICHPGPLGDKRTGHSALATMGHGAMSPLDLAVYPGRSFHA